MKNLNEQLKELPEEFVIEMEQQKKDRWVDVFNFLVNYFDIQNEIDVDFLTFTTDQSDSFYGIEVAAIGTEGRLIYEVYDTG